MIRETKTTIWSNDKGRELVKLGCDLTATVIPSSCNADELDDLAEACCKASEALRLIEETKAEAGA